MACSGTFWDVLQEDNAPTTQLDTTITVFDKLVVLIIERGWQMVNTPQYMFVPHLLSTPKPNIGLPRQRVFIGDSLTVIDLPNG